MSDIFLSRIVLYDSIQALINLYNHVLVTDPKQTCIHLGDIGQNIGKIHVKILYGFFIQLMSLLHSELKPLKYLK